MRRKIGPFDNLLTQPGGPGGGRGSASSGSGPSSSLQGSNWGRGPRPTEQPKSMMELRAAARTQAKQPEVDRAREAAREERKKRFGVERFAEGGAVKKSRPALPSGETNRPALPSGETSRPKLYRKGGMVKGQCRDYGK